MEILKGTIDLKEVKLEEIVSIYVNSLNRSHENYYPVFAKEEKAIKLSAPYPECGYYHTLYIEMGEFNDTWDDFVEDFWDMVVWDLSKIIESQRNKLKKITDVIEEKETK